MTVLESQLLAYKPVSSKFPPLLFEPVVPTISRTNGEWLVEQAVPNFLFGEPLEGVVAGMVGCDEQFLAV